MWDRCKERLLLGIYLLCRSAIHSPDAATDPQVSLRVCDHLAGLRDTLSVSGQCTSTDRGHQTRKLSFALPVFYMFKNCLSCS
jgi:hypothetical protein